MDDGHDSKFEAWLDLAGIAAMVGTGVLTAAAFATASFTIIAAAATLPIAFALVRAARADGDLTRAMAQAEKTWAEAARTARGVAVGADLSPGATTPGRP